MASVAEAAYVISKEIKARRDRHEVDQHVLIFQLRGIRGMTERHTRLSEANARIYVSARVLDDYEDEEVRGEEEEEEDDDAEDVARDEEAPARVERERIPVYRSDERFMSLNPTWDPPHKFTVFLGKEKRDKRLLVGVHDASKASSSDDDTTSIFYYAVLSNLEEFASNAPSVRSSVSSSGLESMLKPVELSLVDDENSKTEAKLIGEAWLATSAQVQQLDVLRRHCVLIYEHRVFQNFVEAFGVGWFMCMCQCDPDFAEPLHEYNNGSDRTTAQWRHYHACVPDDIQRPLSHVPDKDRLGQNHQPPPSFDALSPLLPGERVVKSWHMCRTDAEDVSGWAYATSIASSFWYPSPPPTAIYRRCAWFRYTTTAPRTNTDRV
ncbi:hypothetical protein CTAYLR_004374 [Chrysophaeum taylorii]|uniref:C2 domain-containing protein n=1 Tax=Chrysophaeum taylorii TaxID=2483200 RepID=A0AAD7XQW4_9STRA|nr:hypothetical protein CTAYLR_004374 [Chrysophaeum taylorii]